MAQYLFVSVPARVTRTVTYRHWRRYRLVGLGLLLGHDELPRQRSIRASHNDCDSKCSSAPLTSSTCADPWHAKEDQIDGLHRLADFVLQQCHLLPRSHHCEHATGRLVGRNLYSEFVRRSVSKSTSCLLTKRPSATQPRGRSLIPHLCDDPLWRRRCLYQFLLGVVYPRHELDDVQVRAGSPRVSPGPVTSLHPLRPLYSMIGALNKLPVAVSGMIFFADPVTVRSVSAVSLGFAAGLLYTHAKQLSNEAKRKAEAGQLRRR